MEKKKDVTIKLAELSARFPEDKYIWIMPQLTPSGELPEHLDFGVTERGFSPNPEDGDVYFIDKPGTKRALVNGKWEDVPDEGFVALTGRAVFALGSDAGVKFLPQLNRRLDPGHNPEVLEWTATGMLTGLSGMTPVTKTKHIDLALEREKWEFKARNRPPAKIYPPPSVHDYGNPKDYNAYNAAVKAGVWTNAATEKEFEWYVNYTVKKNELQFKTFMTEIGETKAQLRVIRALIAVAAKYRPSTLKAKKFAVLRVIFKPNAQTAGERRLILAGMMDNYLGAFPGAGQTAGVLAEPEPRAVLSEGEAVRFIDEPEVEEMPDGWSPGDLQAPEDLDPEAEVEPGEPVSRGTETPATPQETEPETTANYAFLESVKALKDKLIELLGQESGEGLYYETLKEYAGVEKSNQVTDPATQGKLYRVLEIKVNEAVEFMRPVDEGEAQAEAGQPEAEPAEQGPGSPPPVDNQSPEGEDESSAQSESPSPATPSGSRLEGKDSPPSPSKDNDEDWLIKARRSQLGKLAIAGIKKHFDALVSEKKYDMKKDERGIEKLIAGPGDPKDNLIEACVALMKIQTPRK